jgi:LAGLIDADG endonuclease
LATVITNLLSAIPVFGQDIVELINFSPASFTGGGEYLTMLNAAISKVLPTIGTVNKHALKKGTKIRLDKQEFLSIPYQFLAFIAGLIDGDGYIQVTRSTKGFITIKLVITIHLEDLSTLEYIHSVLKLGKITINRDHKSPNCSFRISRTDLQEVLFPLFLHHGIFFLTEVRRAQFNLALFILEEELKFYDQIPEFNGFSGGFVDTNLHTALANASLAVSRGQSKEIPLYFELPKTALDYLNLHFFKNWLVGFTQAEGSFCVKANNDGCFQLKQRIHVLLFEAFKLIFKTSRKIETEKCMYNQFSVSSKKDIQAVINFFSFSGFHPLIGLKCTQYLKWLTTLRNSYRYSKLNFPQ